VKPLVARAVNLFTFLAKREEMRSTVVRDLATYERDGAVHWLHTMTDSLAEPGRDEDDHLLTVVRPSSISPPVAHELIRESLSGPLDDPEHRPVPDGSAGRIDGDGGEGDELLGSEDATLAVQEWLARWDLWAEEYKRNEAQKKRYKDFFALYDRSTQESDTTEFILGVGLLSWDVLATEGRTQGKIERIRRHLLTAPIQASMDPTSGDIHLDLDEARLGLTSEIDMIPASEIADQAAVRDLTEAARHFEGSPLDRDAITDLLQDFIHRFHAEGEWTSTAEPPTPGRAPVVSWAPALILRQRRRAGLTQALQNIADRIEEADEVPSGIAPLLDPDQVPPVERDPSPGAVLTIEDEVFSPLPLNDVQRRIIEHVDSHAQTLVQGPPGTGKTHTAAALISHLLAQGKRILITAETERALVEIRGKLPEDLKPLAVSVVGTGREEMAELRTAVNTIAEKSTSHDRDTAIRRLNTLHIIADDLRLKRRALYKKLVDAREVDVAVHHRGHYQGTLARIAEQYHGEEDRYGWIRHLAPASADVEFPLEADDIRRLQAAMTAAALPPDLEDGQGRAPDLRNVPSPQEFAELVHTLDGTEQLGDVPSDAEVHTRAKALAGKTHEDIQSMRATALNLDEQLRALEGARETWVSAAIADAVNNLDMTWRGRHETSTELLTALDDHLEGLADRTVVIRSNNPARMSSLAQGLLDALGANARVKTSADGSVKIGMFTSPIVKESRDLFEGAAVDGVSPSTGAQFQAVIHHDRVRSALQKLDQLWNVDAESSLSGVVRERRDAHYGRLQLLERILLVAIEVQQANAALRTAGALPVRWADDVERRQHLDALDLARRAATARTAVQPVEALEAHLATLCQWKDTAAPVPLLLEAVRTRNVNQYADAYGDLSRLKAHADAAAERDGLLHRLKDVAPRLADALREPDPGGIWLERVASLPEAFDWLAIAPWVAAQEDIDVNLVQEDITRNDEALRRCAEEMASLRAWNHAVDPTRLTPKSRGDLRGYSQLVRRLGKGTGKNADRQRGQIRAAMELCRPAVPVWIMPLYRVTEQFGMAEQMFDVVIVDEASQAGAEAVFLQYLAPKIVVIGDDKQVTPSAVGTKLDDLQELAGRYLADNRYRPYWEDPRRSLFDEAMQRYGGQLTLTEHRRCVPEIIEFSNLIAYRPEKVELVPVRQFGADRLEPFVITHVEDGVEEGRDSHRVNRVEARALVADLRACLDDPQYEGRTMAVISLGGPAQVKLIESQIMEEISAEEISRHEIRVGMPPSFQGSERDVIFLSLVAGPSADGKRIYAQTAEQYVQRFNVAVSRARDQIRLFHTAAVSDFTNKDDLRYRLLDYAYGVVRRGRTLAPGESPFVSETERQEPFDSLFEQRVYNRIASRGFTVQPQFQAIGYSLDLVIVGPKSRVAVECDGDHWHGPEQYKDDMRRQRELERSGWTVFRVRESIYYVDPEKALEPLWTLLEEMKIRPSGWLEEPEAGDTSESPQGHDSHPLAVINETPQDNGGGSQADEISPAASIPDPAAPPARLLEPLAPEKEDGEAAWETSPLPPMETGFTAADRIHGVEGDPFADDVSSHPHVLDPLALGENSEEAPLETFTKDTEYSFQDPSAPDRTPTVSPYPEFQGTTVLISQASPQQVQEGLLAIIGTEGPVLGERARRVYAEASGVRRMGHVIQYALDETLERLVRRGLVLADNPLRSGSIADKTLRLPDQPLEDVREAGPRDIRLVPPREAAARMAQLQEAVPGMSKDELFRATLAAYGQKRLTFQVSSHLDSIHRLMLRMQNPPYKQ